MGNNLIKVIIGLLILPLTNCDLVSIMNGTGTHGSIVTYSLHGSKGEVLKVAEELNKSDKGVQFILNDTSNYIHLDINEPPVTKYVLRVTEEPESVNNCFLIIVSVKTKNSNEYKINRELNNTEKRAVIQLFEERFLEDLKNSKTLQ